MREIKFRAWDKQDKKMLLWGDLLIGSGVAFVRALSVEEQTLMQFTGLKDKNGKEIYEGDICEVRGSFDQDYFCEVIFNYGSFGFKDFDGVTFAEMGTLEYVGDGTGATYPEDKNPKVEVISNIYENPELLNTRYDKSQDD